MGKFDDLIVGASVVVQTGGRKVAALVRKVEPEGITVAGFFGDTFSRETGISENKRHQLVPIAEHQEGRRRDALLHALQKRGVIVRPQAYAMLDAIYDLVVHDLGNRSEEVSEQNASEECPDGGQLGILTDAIRGSRK